MSSYSNFLCGSRSMSGTGGCINYKMSDGDKLGFGDKVSLLTYADNRAGEYFGRIGRIIGRKFSARLMTEVAQ